jgi:competence protein ComEC
MGLGLAKITFDRLSRSPSKTFAVFSATFCFGIILGGYVPQDWWPWVLVLIALLLIATLAVSTRKTRFAMILLAVFAFAVFRASQVGFTEDTITTADFPDGAVRVSGTVVAEVEGRVGSQKVVLDDVAYADLSVEGKLLVWVGLYPRIKYNDTIVFNCRLQKPEKLDGFAYDDYLARRGIMAQCLNPEYIDVRNSDSFSVAASAFVVKDFLVRRLSYSLPEPHASFVAGLLFGGNSGLSSDVKNDFAVTGTSHILAASGFNVSLFSLTFLSWILSTRIGRTRGLVFAALFIFLYVIAAGATPAVVRAGIMGGLFIVQKCVSRRGHMPNIMLATASVMLCANPELVYDVGFQLSFVATAAIIAFTEKASGLVAFIPSGFGLRNAFAGSLVAIVATAPILLWHFGQISVIAPAANLLVLPFVPYIMFFAIAALPFAIVSSALGAFAMLPVWSLSIIVLLIIRLFGAVSFAVVEPSHSQLLAVAFSVLIIIAFIKFYASRQTE